jgi:hypothetical protein
MKDAARFNLKISAYTPDTLPMGRLADYLESLARLMGCEAAVHFKGAKKGSTILCAEVEAQGIGPVEKRLRSASGIDAPADIRKQIDRLNELMREDGARGTLSREGGERFIKFLGVDAVIAERIGPIRETTTVQGEVVRVGGKDRTLHALLVGENGREYRLTTTSKAVARDLATNLFEWVRAQGIGTWFRSESGEWELEELKVEEFERLSGRTLVDAVAELRAVPASGWKKFADPAAVLADLRKH